MDWRRDSRWERSLVTTSELPRSDIQPNRARIEREECYQEVREGEGDRGSPKPNGKNHDCTALLQTRFSYTPVDMCSQAELTDIKLTVLAWALERIQFRVDSRDDRRPPSDPSTNLDFFRFVSTTLHFFCGKHESLIWERERDSHGQV